MQPQQKVIGDNKIESTTTTFIFEPPSSSTHVTFDFGSAAVVAAEGSKNAGDDEVDDPVPPTVEEISSENVSSTSTIPPKSVQTTTAAAALPSPTTTTKSEPPMITIGHEIKTHGLSATEYNDRLGVVVKILNNGRIKISLDGIKKSISVLPSRLSLMGRIRKKETSSTDVNNIHKEEGEINTDEVTDDMGRITRKNPNGDSPKKGWKNWDENAPCHHCGTYDNLKRCSGCKIVRYCSKVKYKECAIDKSTFIFDPLQSTFTNPQLLTTSFSLFFLYFLDVSKRRQIQSFNGM